MRLPLSISAKLTRPRYKVGQRFEDEFSVIKRPSPTFMVDYHSACAQAHRDANALATDYVV